MFTIPFIRIINTNHYQENLYDYHYMFVQINSKTIT